VVPGLFSPEECAGLLTPEIKSSFQQAIDNYPTYYRNNERLVIDNDTLAARLFAKVHPYLPETIEVDSAIPAEQGRWALRELNSRLRFCKYSAHQYFHRHLDGVHYRSETRQSKLTFMIYLNSATEFAGGRTLFYRTKDTDEVWASYVPQQGDLIVFDHNIWHEGEELQSGEKFVLRSDIVYERISHTAPLAPFEGHRGYIWKLLKFDEDTFLSGGRDKSIRVWNAAGQSQQTLYGHENSILCIEKLNPDAFLSGSRDRQIHLWQRQANRQFRLAHTFRQHSALVLSLCRLTDDTFASAGGDTSIQITTTQGLILNQLQEHTNWVWQVILLQDGWLASCSEDETIKIWNYKSPQSIQTFRETCAVMCLAFDTDTRQLISGNLKGELVIRQLDESFQECNQKRMQAHNGIIRTIQILDANRLASGGEDNRIRLWDRKTGRCLNELPHQNFVQSLECLNQAILLTASYDGSIRQWEI
jgi:WD40 repeat protein